MAVFTTRYKRHMENKLRREERKEHLRATKFSDPAPPLLIRFQRDQTKLPASINVELPHDAAVAALLQRGRAVPVGDFNAAPDLVIDENDLQYAGVEFPTL